VTLFKKYWLAFVLAVLVVVAGGMIYQKLHKNVLPSNLVEGSGRVDGDLVNLNVKYPGRIVSISVDDGVKVTKNMPLAKLESKELVAKKAAMNAQIEALASELKAKKIEAKIADESIPLLLKKAAANLSATKASKAALAQKVAIQKALVAQAQRDFSRTQKLYKSKSIEKEKFEHAQLRVSTEQNKLKALKEQLKAAQNTIELASVALENAQASQKKLKAIEAGVEAVTAQLKALKAQKAQLMATIDEMTLRSPLDGITVEKIANVGEVIGAGMSVATLLDPHTLYLKIFVDTIENGKIELGDKAVIFLDAYPNKPIDAKVVRIAQKAEFTPKEVSVRSDRIQRVFALYLKPLKVEPLLKLGLPAIGVVSLDGKALPKSLHDIPEI